jgi:hypothetical protein
MQVVRGGRRKIVSIFDLVVGDIVPLSLGGQVCPFGWMAFELWCWCSMHRFAKEP